MSEGSGSRELGTLDLSAEATTHLSVLRRSRAVEEASLLERGASIGRYIILDKIGSGAMGVVYQAYDPELDRRVAVKCLKINDNGTGSEGSSSARTRLVREAKALAKVAHPNVVAVYDVGRVGGDVFLAMELISGQTLRAWLGVQKPSQRAILRVFLDAGAGLAAAHRAGLIHRDFKPSNVLIDQEGRARVLDFGLARIAGPVAEEAGQASPVAPSPRQQLGGTELHTTVTGAGALVGTPRYMAPEQHSGATVDARADQFAFCVALYKALYDEFPFEGRSLSQFSKTLAAGEIREPPKNSKVSTWMRNVLLRGLSVDPSLRYPSMEALLDALRRDPSAVRRRALRLTGFVALAAVAAFGLLRPAGESVRLCRGAKQHLAGRWDSETADAVEKRFLASGRPYAGDTFVRVAMVLENYTNSWLAMYRQACEATHVRGEQSQQLLDLRMACLAGRIDKVGAVTSLFARTSDPAIVDRAVAAVLDLPDVGRCADEKALTAEIPPPEDAKTYEQARKLRAKLNKAEALRHAGQHKQALALTASIVDEARDLEHLPLRARAFLEAGSLQRGADAESSFYEAAMAAAEARAHDLVADAWLRLLWEIGVVQGRPGDALALKRAAEVAVAQAGQNPIQQGQLANNLGAILYTKGDYEQSRAHHERALALRLTALGPDHRLVSMSYSNLGGVSYTLGRYEMARTYHQRALAIREQIHGPDHPMVAVALTNLAKDHTAEQEYDQALELGKRALAIRQNALGRENLTVASTLIALGDIYLGMGQTSDARQIFERALAIRQRALGSDHPELAPAIAGLGRVLQDQRNYQAALDKHLRAIALWNRAYGPSYPGLARPLTDAGSCELELGNAAGAVLHLERAFKLQSRRPRDKAALAEIQFALARALYGSSQDRKRALRLAARAESVLRGRPSRAVALAAVRSWLQARAAAQ